MDSTSTNANGTEKGPVDMESHERDDEEKPLVMEATTNSNPSHDATTGENLVGGSHKDDTEDIEEEIVEEIIEEEEVIESDGDKSNTVSHSEQVPHQMQERASGDQEKTHTNNNASMDVENSTLVKDKRSDKMENDEKDKNVGHNESDTSNNHVDSNDDNEEDEIDDSDGASDDEEDGEEDDEEDENGNDDNESSYKGSDNGGDKLKVRIKRPSKRQKNEDGEGNASDSQAGDQPQKKKRKRRTKAEMVAAKAAEEAERLANGGVPVKKRRGRRPGSKVSNSSDKNSEEQEKGESNNGEGEENSNSKQDKSDKSGDVVPGWIKALQVRKEKREKQKELEIEQYQQMREKKRQEQKRKEEEDNQAKIRMLQASLQKSVPVPTTFTQRSSSAVSQTQLPPIISAVQSTDPNASNQPKVESNTISQQALAESAANAPKRARARRPMGGVGSSKPKLDFSEPDNCATPFNCSEVIKNFLYLGAGYDVNGRCLTNRQSDPQQLRLERLVFCRQRNIAYALNMAASPLQEQLIGIEYPPPEIRIKGIDMNDLDEWLPEMSRMFDDGAAFIEEASVDHLNKLQQISDAQASSPPGSSPPVQIKPPAIFVHCVAGVNRSPMVVVWWLAKYHGFSVHEAWDLVRKRRDTGAQWKGIALGGAVVDDDDDKNNTNSSNNNGSNAKSEDNTEKDLTAPSSYQWVEVPQVGEKKKPHPKLEWYKHAKEAFGIKPSTTPPPISRSPTQLSTTSSSSNQQQQAVKQLVVSSTSTQFNVAR